MSVTRHLGTVVSPANLVTLSRLLLSPTLQDVRAALATMLFEGEALDTLTITFAGHGAASSGSFYMALRDARLNALSATALSLADLLRMIAESKRSKTLNSGYLGSRNDEERSEMRYVM